MLRSATSGSVSHHRRVISSADYRLRSQLECLRNFIKEHVLPIKDDVTDFCIDGAANKSDNTEKEKQFEKKVSLNKTHWQKAALKEKSTVLQLRKRAKLLFPSQY